MRRFMPALACLLAIPAFALAYPPATVEDVAQTSVKVAGLDCGTQYRIHIEERNSSNTDWTSLTTHTPTTAACTPPPPPPPPPPGCQNPPCWDFLGNNFNGDNFNQVMGSAQDLAVSGDGHLVSGTHWEESAHDVRVLTPTGASVGPRPGNSSGRFRETGGGPRAVEITNTHVWAAQQRRVVRWDRAIWINWANRGQVYQGTTFTVPGMGELSGITVCGGRVFVADPGAASNSVTPATSRVKALSDSTGAVLNTWTVPHARHLACDRQGNVWVLQQRMGTTPARLARYSPTGAPLGSFALSGEPMDVATNPNGDEVLIADNGPDQRIETFTYTGAPNRTIGESYLNGPTPGLLGPIRFAGPRGVDVDQAGNVYVLQTFAPGRGTLHWQDGELSDTAVFSKHQPNGTQIWRRMGVIGMPGEANSDKSRFYTNNVTYERVNGRWEPRALNIDGFSGDPRFPNGVLDHRSGSSTTVYREFGGHRWIAKPGNGPSTSSPTMRVFRLDGEIGRLTNTFTGSFRDWWIAENGDVWKGQSNGTVQHFRMIGISNGVPQYAAAAITPPAPGFTSVYRMEVHGNTVYVSGYGPGAEFEAGFDDWKFSGKRIARFNGLPTASGWSSRAWTTSVFWGAYPNRPVSMSTDGDRVAVAYLRGVGLNKGGIRLYDADTGAPVGNEFSFPAEYGTDVGWFDMPRSLTSKNGLMGVEANGQAKTTTFIR
jgi:hypothetical protein